MKISFKFTVLGILSFAFFSACTTTSEKKYSDHTYTKTNPKNIEILIDYPSRPYIEIGEIKGKGAALYTGDKDVKDAIRETAADMGADAVILRGKSLKYDYWGLNNERKAIAIKWKAGSDSISHEKEATSSTAPASSSGGLPVPQSVH